MLLSLYLLVRIFSVFVFHFPQDPTRFISAKVENIVSYGAFFGLEDGCSGFVHISQVFFFSFRYLAVVNGTRVLLYWSALDFTQTLQKRTMYSV